MIHIPLSSDRNENLLFFPKRTNKITTKKRYIYIKKKKNRREERLVAFSSVKIIRRKNNSRVYQHSASERTDHEAHIPLFCMSPFISLLLHSFFFPPPPTSVLLFSLQPFPKIAADWLEVFLQRYRAIIPRRTIKYNTRDPRFGIGFESSLFISQICSVQKYYSIYIFS